MKRASQSDVDGEVFSGKAKMNLDEETQIARLIRATERLSSVVGVTKLFSLCLNKSRRLGDLFHGKDWGLGFAP